ncbi:hypothetical protein Rhal01_02615 [Rubritalea halochordaticola]|uniref:Uncharacterized protein n=1 Tax=Rubritalea halochordaticola TaxID=714537 RepID=A0ABP9V733_9BACT
MKKWIGILLVFLATHALAEEVALHLNIVIPEAGGAEYTLIGKDLQPVSAERLQAVQSEGKWRLAMHGVHYLSSSGTPVFMKELARDYQFGSLVTGSLVISGKVWLMQAKLERAEGKLTLSELRLLEVTQKSEQEEPFSTKPIQIKSLPLGAKSLLQAVGKHAE